MTLLGIHRGEIDRGKIDAKYVRFNRLHIETGDIAAKGGTKIMCEERRGRDYA